MAIVSHTVSTTTQANGSTHNIVLMVDTYGQEYMASFFLNAGSDLAAKITSLIAATESGLAEAEFEQTLGGG